MKKTLYLIGIAILLGSCATTSRTSQTQKQTPDVSKSETTIKATPKTYLASATRTIDIIHTKLDVSFNWEKQYLYGKAYITLKPYFYPIKDIILNAQGFEIKTISLFSKNQKNLLYAYDGKKLTISLDKEYTKNDTLQIFVDYVAKPNEKKSDSGVAIASDKGLYFINPLGDEKSKPTQLWTQGEPESNSSWFPTVDKPNERMTQEISITLDSVHKKFVTLSNGLLISSKENKDKSRTDYWKQSLPAAPYLTMMAIGDFVI
ncbi:MAG TPA: M1 family peptidase, partial [Bacteroidia bacterium]|nr:M1 family peptidase [Bacteroidia bacterium]